MREAENVTIAAADLPGCDIVVTGNNTGGVFTATGLKINGREVFIPEDATIGVAPAGAKDPLVVTLTVFATSLRFEGS